MTLDEYLNTGEKSPADIAAEAGITVSSLSRIRRGEQNTTRDVMRKIIAASGGKVSAEGLLGVHGDLDDTAELTASATNLDQIIRREADSRAAPFSATSSPTNAPSSASGGATPATLACSAGPRSMDDVA